MEVRAQAKYVRISPRKVKTVNDLIKGKPVGLALAIIRSTPKAASEVLEKIIKSAIANAENNNGMDASKLFVAGAYADPGPIQKRIMPRAHGRAYRINKRSSHITIVLKEKE